MEKKNETIELIKDGNPSKEFAKSAYDWSQDIEGFMKKQFREEVGKKGKIIIMDRQLTLPSNNGGHVLNPDDVLKLDIQKTGKKKIIAVEVYGYHKDTFDTENENKVLRDLSKLNSLLHAKVIHEGHIILTHPFYDALIKSNGYINYALFHVNKKVKIHNN